MLEEWEGMLVYENPLEGWAHGPTFVALEIFLAAGEVTGWAVVQHNKKMATN